MNEPKVHWAAQSYDESMSFVSRNGESLFEWLKPEAGERILDLGCGTGDLAAKIAESAAYVEGVDISPEMIERARTKYPNLAFHCMDAARWQPDLHGKFDAVFSNAALHWIRDAEAAVRTIADSLAAGGRFVAEFGGVGNVQSIADAVRATLVHQGREDAFVMPWYFPTVGEYASLLERHGFEVRIATLIDRPTRLEGEDGMLNWLRVFGNALMPGATAAEERQWMVESVERLRPTHRRGNFWMLEDYRRIRVMAVKVR